MKKLIFLLLVLFEVILLHAQPDEFTWSARSDTNYISPAKDQCEQGPCGIFAAVAAVEALSHIYYNKPFSAIYPYNELDLAEAEIYSACGGYGRFIAAPGIENSLKYIDTTGIINETCFAFPDSCFRNDCENICQNPFYEVNIPGYEQLYPNSNQELKRKIINYGPIAVSMSKIGGVLHEGGGTTDHSVLLIGWSSLGWHIKDSWPGDAYISFKNFNIFDPYYNAKFWRVKYEHNEEVITCTGSGCSSVFSSRSYTDNDGDGFYYWGIDPKPAGCPGPCKMDFNDADYYIYLNNTSGCSTSAYQWSIPAGWTLYEQTGNYIRINTNETPSAMLTVSATTCCNTNHLIKTQYFGESYSCGGYLMVYPNPATSEFNIEFDDTFDLKTVDKTTTLEIYDPDYSRKYYAEKFEKRIKIKTDGWKRGHYYIIFSYKGQRHYERIAIEN
jgi:hypothetical protein